MANSFNYKQISLQLLAGLAKERDRDVLTRRYGLGLANYETLDRIGKRYGVTRERVRQIERAAIKRLQSASPAEVKSVNKRLVSLLAKEGNFASLHKLASVLKADSQSEHAYVSFLAQVSPDIGTIEENRQLNTTLFVKQHFSKAKISELSAALVEAFREHGKPARISEISQVAGLGLGSASLQNLARCTKALANFEGEWGLTAWPRVNPRSIRDRAFLALHKHQEPLHFSDIAIHIERITPSGRNVTTQAVHNELIKDERFILIGRGIYALADWGYTSGTVADIIKEVLSEEQPLHKDEIIRRVLLKRRVKTTTIALNLQEKDHFLRVSKAVYRLK